MNASMEISNQKPSSLDSRQTSAKMGSATPLKNPNPSSNGGKGKHVHHIGGIPVEFPYQPYGSQLAFMGRVISTLDRAQREGHCHALLESPTGTGKSLSLLCSALAWQQNFRNNNLNADLSNAKPNPEALSDPINHGGGFIPETQSSSISESESVQPPPLVANSKAQKKKTVPTIFYASRTHSQISQLIREYRKTGYRVPMTILASRKHYCTNAHVRGKENLDEECKLLLKNGEVSCPEFKNYQKVKGHPSLKKGGCHEAHDIEDLVKVGEIVKGCSYYAACSMAEDAQLIFCPYSYIVNPIVRGAVDVDIKGAIVILDEAHNIEDMARDAGSVDIDEDVLHELQTELGQLCMGDTLVYQPLLDMTEGIISWMQQRKGSLPKREFQDYFSCWTGEKALQELQDANISRSCFPILHECATKAIKIATDTEAEVPRLSGKAVITLEGLFSSLSYFFSGNGIHTHDYQLALHRYVKKEYGNSPRSWVYTFGLWCLNPAVVFKGIADLSLSVILTSGTLSPINSFSSELGVQFGTCLEAPHVIDTESQLWAAVISNGPGNHPLNASFKTADGYAFQDALGTSLEGIFKIVPGGSLVFFPSYKLMEKLCSRWHETGQWSRLNVVKPIFIEPRGGSQDDFESAIKGYYDGIHGARVPASGRKSKGKKNFFSQLEAIGSKKQSKKDGAAFLAVCRGKVSEGIDFSDENARAVVSLRPSVAFVQSMNYSLTWRNIDPGMIIVGIPFPNIYNNQVAQKKKYNDTYKSSKSLLSGSEWYCHQAFRALNQAAGRCIRHRFDYGAVIFLDQRFQEERNTAYISKWLRKSIKQYDSFEKSLDGLRSFFSDKEDAGKETTNVVQISDDEANFISKDCSKGVKRKKSQKLNKAGHSGNKMVSKCGIAIEKPARFCQSLASNTKCFASLPQRKYTASATRVLVDEDDEACGEYIDLESHIDKELRCSTAANKVLSCGSPERSLVMETPIHNINTGSPRYFSSGDSYCQTINQVAIPDQLFSGSFTSSAGPCSKGMRESMVTPERNISTAATPENDSPLNLSVNSHYQKRRMLVDSFIHHTQDPSTAPASKISGQTNFTGSPFTHVAANCGADDGMESEFTKSNPSQMILESSGVPYLSSRLVMDQRLQIFCSLCRNPLGLPEDNHYVHCTLTSMSKVHLGSLVNEVEPPNVNKARSTHVLVADLSSVDKRLQNRGSHRQGIWCEEDGCVFRSLFCPYCTTEYCLGVQVIATDASNIQLLNKILFYRDKLCIKSPESSKEEELATVCCSNLSEVPVSCSAEEISSSNLAENSGGWRTTKSKLRLPRRGL